VGDAGALERALDTLLADPDRLPGIGVAARQRVESAFSVESVGGALARVLRGCAGPA
jgi:glycosyltransferase involved in cell wall biosynthesis